MSDLSWVGDGTVGFAVTDTPGVREEVRTLDTSAAGSSLLAASHVVWSQYVPAPPRGSNPAHAPQACGTPFLTGNGQAVVCAASSYSARDKRLSALWLAYPLATPTRPLVIGSVRAAAGRVPVQLPQRGVDQPVRHRDHRRLEPDGRLGPPA